jgi:hypothetical protein
MKLDQRLIAGLNYAEERRRSFDTKFGELKYKIAFDFELIYTGRGEDRSHFQRPFRAANSQRAFDGKPPKGLGGDLPRGELNSRRRGGIQNKISYIFGNTALFGRAEPPIPACYRLSCNFES